MDTNYTLKAFTLQRPGDMSRIVTVSDAIKSPQLHLSYQDYIKGNMNSRTHSKNAGRHFAYYERPKAKCSMKMTGQRQFAKKYAKSLPILSEDQKLLCIPRFSSVETYKDEEQSNLIDIFDCSSQQFWDCPDELDTSDQRYLLSLELMKKTSKNFETVTFSSDNRYASVLCMNKIMLYDLEFSLAQEENILTSNRCRGIVFSQQTLRIQSLPNCSSTPPKPVQNKFKRVAAATGEANENCSILSDSILRDESSEYYSELSEQSSDQGRQIVYKPVAQSTLLEKTYDRILSQFLNNDDIQKSWVILQSKTYSQIHMLTFQDLFNQNNAQSLDSSMGGNFIKASNQVRFTVYSRNIANFWNLIKTKFTQNGAKVIIQTLQESYIISLQEEAENYLKISEIPYLKGKRVKIFNRTNESEDMLFSEVMVQKQRLQFSALKHQESSDFSNTWLSCKGTARSIKIQEVLEFVRQGQKVMRIIAIRDSEELMCWEVLDNCHGNTHYRSINGAKLLAFRWPFVAYCTEPSEISIVHLAHTECVVHQKIDSSREEDQDGFIQQMCFSYDANLYVLVYTRSTEILYQLNMKQHFHCNEDNQQLGTNLVQEIMRIDRDQKTADSSYEMFVVELDLGLYQLVNIIELKKNKWRILTVEKGKEPAIRLFNEKITQICNLNRFCFVISEANQENLRLIRFEYDTINFYQDKIFFRSTTHQIVKILADKNKLYIMCRAGSSYLFRCFNMKSDDELIQTGQINNIQDIYPQFIEEFDKSTIVNSNIIFANEQKIVKIYQNQRNQSTSLQSYFNYLPQDLSPAKDRIMPHRNKRNCHKYNKLLLFFNYPHSCQPKTALIIPYIGDNIIALNKQKNSNLLTWLQEVKANVTTDQFYVPQKINTIVPRIFQFHRRKFLLHEFDLNGTMQNKSNHIEHFKGEQVLAISPSKMRCLTTPEDTEYLKVLKIKEITCEHACIELIRHVITSQVSIADQANETLFQVMCDLKQGLNCKFNFAFNDANMEISMACFLPNRNMIACFVIENVKNQPAIAFPVYVNETYHSELFYDLLACIRSSKFFKTNQSYQQSNEIALENFQQILQFKITEHKIVLWSKTHILYANLDGIRQDEASCSNKKYLLTTNSNFEILTSVSMSKRQEAQSQHLRRYCNASSNAKRALFQSNSQTKSLQRYNSLRVPNAESETLLKSSQDIIEQIYCRNKVINKTPKDGQAAKQEEVIVIKVRHKASHVYLFQYNLDKGVEMTWLECSKESQVFYSDDESYMIADPEIGVINLETKEVLHEYHINNKHFNDMQTYDMSWGKKLVLTDYAQFFIAPNEILMPYSLLSVVQMFQDDAFDQKIEQFHTEDYYRLDGQTQLHKLIYNSLLLEKLLDDYWSQNKIFIVSVLVERQITNKSTSSSASSFDIQEEYQDILDAQIEMSCDRLISKTLYYLSNLPIQLSFNQILPKLYKMSKNARLTDYIDAWPQQTSQMTTIRVLFTDMPSGLNKIPHNCSYLTKEFFSKYPTERNNEIHSSSLKRQNTQKNIKDLVWDSDDDDFKKISPTKIEEEQEHTLQKELKQVDIKMLQVNWVAHKYGLKLWSKMKKPECLHLFESKTVKLIVEYSWSISRQYFIISYLLPYVFLCFCPLVILCILTEHIEDNFKDFGLWTAYYFFLICFSLGNIFFANEELYELWCKGLRKYVKDFRNYIQWITIFVNFSLIILVLKGKLTIDPEQEEFTQLGYIQNLRILLICSVLFNGRELLLRFTIFDKFAIFAEQMREIVIDALPLAGMLSFIVLAQTILLWMLDQNRGEDSIYHGIIGFGNCFVDSYRLALGDFFITYGFVDGTQGRELIVFWLVFFFSTLMTLLIIFNMLIALMSDTFERVQGATELHILQTKLMMIQENYFRFPDRIKKKMEKNKYILAVVVDPEADPIEKDSMEHRLSTRIDDIDQNLVKMREYLVRSRMKQDFLFVGQQDLQNGLQEIRKGQEELRQLLLAKEQ